jgi:hypothetical protein
MDREQYLLYMLCKEHFHDLVLLNCQAYYDADAPDTTKLKELMGDKLREITQIYVGYWTLSTTPDEIRAWFHTPNESAHHFLYQETFSHILAHVRKGTPIEKLYTHHQNPEFMTGLFAGVHGILISALHLLMEPHNTKRFSVAVPLKREWSDDDESKGGLGWLDGEWEYNLDVPFHFDPSDKTIIVTQEGKYSNPTEGYFIKRVEFGSPLTNGNVSVTLTMKEIIGMCNFVGIPVDMSEWDGTYPDSDPDSLDREYTIDTYTTVSYEEDNSIQYGVTIHDSESPEEGYMMLGKRNPPWTK